MLKDARGLDITTDSNVAVAAIDKYMEQCLCYGNRAESCILAAVAADPKSLLANTFAAAYYLTQENTTEAQHAISYLHKARNHFAQACSKGDRNFQLYEF